MERVMAEPGTLNRGEAASTTAPARAPAPRNAVQQTGRDHEGIFLSPRVVDLEAFNQFSSTLRGLIEQAAAHADALRAACADAQLARDSLSQLGVKTRPQVEAALKAMQAVERRLHEAGQTVTAAESAAEELRRLQAQARAGVQDLHERIDAMIESRVSERVQALLQLRLGEGERHLADAVERLQHQARARADELEQRVAEFLRRMDDHTRLVGDTLNARIEQAEQRAARTVGQLGTAAEERLAEIRAKADELLRPLDEAVRRAHDLLGGGVSPQSVERASGADSGREESGRAVEGGARTALDEIRSLLDRAAVVRRDLALCLDDSTARVEHLRTTTDDLKHAISNALVTCDEADRTLSERRREAERLIAALEGPLAEVRHGVTDAGERLRDTLHELTTARTTAEAACRGAQQVLDRLSSLLSDLEPWKELLTSQGRGEVPQPIRDMIEAVRGEMVEDLARIAAAMEQISVKTQHVAQKIKHG
jgi:chromosome segregation ATPase